MGHQEGRRLLTDELLEGAAKRAPDYDRDNVFFTQDFEELRDLGYLGIAVPEALGGHGFTLPEVALEQRRLAYHAGPTALGVNMHLYWTGVAADLHHAGDDSLDWLLREAAAGRVIAAGHGEVGNDLGLGYSVVRAEPTGDGGYRFHGRKTFTSLSPVWDWLGIHALDDSDPDNPRVVHAFVRREDPGHRIEEVWDTLGARATSSHDTILEGVEAAAPYVTRVLPAGPTNDPFVASIFGWVFPLFGNVYYGIAQRALDLAVAGVGRATSLELGGRPLAEHPLVQWNVAEAALRLQAIEAQIDVVARDWALGADHGATWPARLFGAKYNAVEGAKEVVDLALRIAGGGAFFRRNELERLYRDVRAGGFHPPNANLVHDVVGKTALGVL
ncbi:acyl-CoA dehydrogenase family protein [Streptosporangium saharense]|uniref:acyl-CoA dehydrogenase family protein n=1 Tax=Streptosporangium saharense TaxID=1706840 RepID=UPI0036D16DD1